MSSSTPPLGTTGNRPPTSELEVAPGDRIGRFIADAPLGSGGMAFVLAAHDRELDRRVAVKLLRQPASDEKEQARLLREAKLMASLTHNNVASVFDVGLHRGRVFIAMELIEGVTLRRWLGVERPWPAVLTVMIAAGQGLIAAHEAGVVHRDFKPENVMVADDGRAVVMDFGIARDTAEAASDSADVERATTGKNVEASTTGGLGTPRYMAPEQHLWRPTDARTDQFAFCLVLYEALYGQRPFKGETWPELLAAVNAGRVEPRPTTSVPARLHRALSRGLAVEPDHRFASMSDLLEALAAAGKPRRWPWAVAAAVGAGTVVATTWLATARETCEAGADRIAAVYGAPQRVAAAAAFEASGQPFAQEAWTRWEGRLDAYAQAWRRSYLQACRDGGDQLDPRRLCLEAARSTLEVTVKRLAEADAALVERSQTLARLPPLERCDEPGRFAAEVPQPADATLRGAVAALRARHVEVRAMASVRRDDDALVAARELVAEAQELGFEPLVAEVLVTLGRVQAQLADFVGALQTLERAAGLATQLGHDHAAVEATATGLGVVSPHRDSEADVERWLGHARAAQERWRRAGGVETGRFEWYAAKLELRRDNPDGARALYERVLELAEQTGDEVHQADALAKLAEIAAKQLRFRDASDYGERAVAAAERALGVGHPGVSRYMSTLGEVRLAQGELQAAGEVSAQAIANLERARGDHTRPLAKALHVLATAEFRQGHFEEALAAYRRSEDTLIDTLDAGHPTIQTIRGNRGLVLYELGRYEEALAIHAASLPLTEARFGPDSRAVASHLNNLGIDLQALERFEEARPLHERACKIHKRIEGPRSPELAVCLNDLGNACAGLGDTPCARVALARAVSILTEKGVFPKVKAAAQTLLDELDASK